MKCEYCGTNTLVSPCGDCRVEKTRLESLLAKDIEINFCPRVVSGRYYYDVQEELDDAG